MQFYELSTAAETLFERACAVSTNLRHDYVEPEHFLLALTIDAETVVARILNSFGMSNASVRPVVQSMHRSYPEGQERVIEQLTEVSTYIINSSIGLAQHRQAGGLATPLYVLVLLIQSKDKNVLHVFDALGVDPDEVARAAAKSILANVN